jgi:hypothetical protein
MHPQATVDKARALSAQGCTTAKSPRLPGFHSRLFENGVPDDDVLPVPTKGVNRHAHDAMGYHLMNAPTLTFWAYTLATVASSANGRTCISCP